MNLEHASDSLIKLDRMRYTKDTFSANLILVAIVLDALYFVKLYQQDVSDYYYKWWIGASVIYNLVFMLAAFLCSEGVKARRTNMTVLLVVLAVMQFVRIGQIPARIKDAVVLVGEESKDVVSDGSYAFLVAMLVISGLCLVLAAVSSTVNSVKLDKYMKSLENQSA